MTKTRRGGLVIALFTFITTVGGITAPLVGQTATGTLQGKIIDSLSRPVAFARVMIVGSPLIARADTGGRYRIDGVPAGTQSLRVSYVGFKPKEVAGIRVDSGQVVAQDVSLEFTMRVIPDESGMVVTPQAKPVSKKKPTASRHLSKENDARRRLMGELYQIAVAPMALRAGRAGLLLDRLMMDDQERRIAELERLRPRPVRRPVPVLIARQGDPIGRQGL